MSLLCLVHGSTQNALACLGPRSCEPLEAIYWFMHSFWKSSNLKLDLKRFALDFAIRLITFAIIGRVIHHMRIDQNIPVYEYKTQNHRIKNKIPLQDKNIFSNAGLSKTF